jgi:DNA-binding response OmpR family regulator
LSRIAHVAGVFSGRSTHVEPAILWVDRTTYLATVGGSVRLTTAEFDLVSLLIEHQGRIVSYVDIVRRVFECHTTNASLLARVHVCRIRRALGPACDIIATVGRRGYRIDMDRVVEAAKQRPSDLAHRDRRLAGADGRSKRK